MDIVPKWVQSLSEKILPPIWLVASICLFCGTIGYLPKEKLSSLGFPNNDTVFYHGLRIIFWFTLTLLLMAFLRYLLFIGQRLLSRAGPSKFEELTDPEQATLFLLDTIPGKTLEIHDNWDIAKMLVDKKLIEYHIGMGFIVPKDPYEKYYLTDLGKVFIAKNRKKLDEKFSNKERTAALVNPYLRNKVGFTRIPTM